MSAEHSGAVSSGDSAAIWHDVSSGTAKIDASFEDGLLASCQSAEVEAFYAELRAHTLPVAGLSWYSRLLALTGQNLPSFDEASGPPWLPLGVIGPVLTICHYDPAALKDLPFPKELVQPVIVPPIDYRALLIEIRGSAREYCASVIGDFQTVTFVPFPKWSPQKPSKGRHAASRNAMLWLLEMGLISSLDRGMAVGSLSKEEFNPAELNADMSLGLRHILSGTAIAKRDFLKFSAVLIPGAPAAYLEKLKVFPFWINGKDVGVLMSDADDTNAADALSSRFTGKLHKVLVAPETLIAFFQSSATDRRSGALVADRVSEGQKADLEISAAEIERCDPLQEDDSTKTCKWMLYEAVRRGASDLHITAIGDMMVATLAIDNAGQVLLKVPERRLKGVSVILKGLSDMKPDGVQHDEGNFSLSVAGRIVDLRVSLIIVRGSVPKWTLRLLDKSIGIRSLGQLGLAQEDLSRIRTCSSKPFGLIVVSGPTGHGKSTTLYGALNDLNTPEKFIYTLEDPVEYDIPGIHQMVATSDKDRIAEGVLSFPEGIKRILRADPDVAMIAEIRDRETANAAVSLAMTGHLVLTTVHANDVLTIISRLRDLGVEPLMLARSLVMATSQRLVRKLCTCHSYAKPSAKLLRKFEENGIAAPRHVHTAVGCTTCNFIGYKGRAAVVEFLPITREVREAIMAGVTDSALLRLAEEAGYKNLAQKGLELVAKGLTTYEEVEKISASDDEGPALTVVTPRADTKAA